MSNYLLRSTLKWLIILAVPIPLSGQTQTVGLFLNDSSSFKGYTLFAPASYTNTYLINNEGLLVNTWKSNHTPGLSAYLLKNGNLLRTATLPNFTFSGGGSGGLIQELDWNDTLVWAFEYSTNAYYQHHDIEQLPNGNVLVLAWEYKDYDEVLQAGRKPELLSQQYLWPDHIVEVQPDGPASGKVVWEWHVWDHLIQDYDPSVDNYGKVAQHPELVDINYVGPGHLGTTADWNHMNAIAYNESLDQIILSVHRFSEIWVIDHSTTSLEAAGHTGGNRGKGGDLLYRWGNPQAYDRGDATDQKLFGPHDAHWIEPGLPGEKNILIFNNGRNRPGGNFSSVDEISPPIKQEGDYSLKSDSTYLPDTIFWSYTATNPTDFFAANLSGSQRQPNGNTLICNGPGGEFFEITSDGDIVWLYVNPVIKSGPLTQGDSIPIPESRIFKIYRYAPDYPGFSGKQLTPGDQIEIYPPTSVERGNELNSANEKLSQIYPNPTNNLITIETDRTEYYSIEIYSLNGQLIFSERFEGTTHQIDLSSFQKGVYFITIRAKDFVITRKIIRQ